MISVCVATYNGEKYIEQQLRSILKQLSPNDEVIVSDDNSSDRTCDIIESINDTRIKLYHVNLHSCKWNFQYALQQASGDIIFMSDQDDVWLDGKVERCLKELEICDLVVTNSMETDEQLNIINDNFFAIYNSGTGIIKNALNNTYYGSCMAFRKHLLDYALPLPETKEIGHDIWIGLVAEMVGKVRFINQPFLLYRRHNSTVTNTQPNLLTRSNRNLFIKIWSRFVVLFHVCKFYIKNGK